MQQQNYLDLSLQHLPNMTTQQLREHWSYAWKLKPPKCISRRMLLTSLRYKLREVRGEGLSHEQQAKLDQLVRAYKRSQSDGTKRQMQIKSGTQLIRQWNGKRHTVTVKNGFFEYDAKIYKSLSAVASEIAGTRWNGWVFFGVKRPTSNKEVA